MIFFESWEKGAHQLFNHTDTDKIIIVPDGESEVD